MEQITISAKVKAPAEKVWELWTSPKHITKWNAASDDWHTPRAENNLRVGGRFLSRMEAKDGSFGFDFTGIYDEVEPLKRIAYTMEDGRRAIIDFKENEGVIEIITVFDAETQNSIDMQRAGWQAILDNFKRYAESK
jgi:uncharacterized protein YndB with AHSA1/START domain